jgi:hypothetical protein
MYKMITLAALTLVLAQTALANYSCHGDNGETLNIEEDGAVRADGKTSQVTATFTTIAATEVFTGTKTVSSPSAPANYSLTNAQGEAVGLEIRVVNHYGGRCGRCGDDWGSSRTYALLTLPQQETVSYPCD